MIIGLVMVGIPLLLGWLKIPSLGNFADSLLIWILIFGVIIVIWRFTRWGKN